MGKFYIIRDCYFPNTAPTNRMMGFIKGFSELGIKTDVVFFMPDFSLSKAPQIDGVTYHYYWKYLPTKNRILRFFYYQFIYVYILYFKIKRGDKVLVLGCDDVVTLLSKKKGIDVYYERTEHTNYSRTRFLNYRRFFRACANIKGLFMISEPLKKLFVEHGADENKTYIINMIVDSSRFTGLVKQATERYIAYCGTASNNKDGVDELIKSFALVHKKHSDIKLYIIGKTPDKEDSAGNLRLVEDLGIKDYVVFTGIVQASEMPQLLKNAEIVALDRPDSLQAQHGFPTKLGEYLLTENPVVVTKVGDIPLFIKDGETGLLAEERNPKEFSEKLIWAIEHPKEAAEIGKCGAVLAMREFNYLNETKKMASIIFKD